jgi:hypothetical protein
MPSLALLCSLALVACGGGGDGAADQWNKAEATQASPVDGEAPARLDTPAELREGARLSRAALEEAEAQAAAQDQDASGSTTWEDGPAGALEPKSAYTSGQVARKAAATRMPAYRFYNTQTGVHFYTTSETERAHVAANLSPPYSFDGPAFSVANAFSPGLSPVHRFYNTQTGVHFYTISEAERANVVANLPQFNYEGVAYHASLVAGAGLTPLYRFYVPSKGFHFFTASDSEKASIIANLAATYSYEGVGYHVLTSDWRAEKLAHTGVTASQCFQAGSDTLVACNSAGANALNQQQDGHRSAINPISFSAVDGQPLTNCVKDNVTGLIWEGKDSSGIRADSHTYTNLGDGNPSDASRYVTTVNAINLCGFSDWRLPTRNELLSIVNFDGRGSLDPNWFPNTVGARNWASEPLIADNRQGWYVGVKTSGTLGTASGLVPGISYPEQRTTAMQVRLVRGNAPSGNRFSYSTVAYGSDSANNVVNDAWSGLQWRRCEQGRIWNGAACTGTATTFTKEEALAHAGQQSGWRLANIRELGSLSDLRIAGNARIDQMAFPDPVFTVWASTPMSSNAGYGWGVYFGYGAAYPFWRNWSGAVRLVRTPQ